MANKHTTNVNKYRQTPQGKALKRLMVKARKARKKDVINRLKDRPCMDCGGWFNPWQMDFDHRDRADKHSVISHLIGSWAKMYREIKKCDIVCSNCHRERTYRRQDWTHLQEAL